jgi:Ubiquitin-protein ligase
VADLEDKDPELAKNLRWCLENDVTDLDFTFTYESEVFGEPITRELIPKGENIKVDNDNKKEYVKKFCGALMVKEIEPQIQAFLKGFRSLIPLKYISHLSSSEFELLITGVQVIDKEAMKRTCSYQNCSPDSQLAKWFWEILDEFQPEELSSFIYFLSGTT